MAKNWNRVDLLEIVECFAEGEGWISDEEALSARFDEEVMPGILETHGKRGVAFEDTGLINEAFGSWTDGLCKDGEIHPEQYSKYEYVGEWS